MKWLLIFLSALPLANAAPVSLFDGKTLAGWEMPAGEEKWWQVKDGMIVGGSLEEKVPTNLFLSSAREFQNFELTFKIRLVKGAGFMNSGMQVRSTRDAGKSPMSGYQVDAGIGYWGDLYDEHRRDKKLTGPMDPAALAKVVKDWEWNDYRILCEGRRIRSWINGQPTLDYNEADPAISLTGKLGIQVHSGGTLLVQLKDISINELAATAEAPPKKAAKASMKKQGAEGSTANTPEEERQAFQLPEGFVAELVTSEVQGVGKPITMAWDARGRLWTMTALEYPVDANENRANAEALYARGGKDQVLVIDHPEKSEPQPARVFAEGLALPLGLLPDLDGNGAFVHYGSQIRHYVDTDKDGKADKFDVVLEGFGIQDSHLMPHQFERAPGGWIYVAQGLFNDSIVRRPGGLPFADGSKEKPFKACKLARFRPDGSDFELVSAGPNNIWGFFQTRAGETFLQEANDMGIPVTEFEPGTHYSTSSKDKLRSYAPQIPASMQPIMGGTGLSGLAVAEDRDSAFAKAYGGAAHVIYVANPITGRIQVITTTVAENRHPEYSKREDFLVSNDPWFRPVSVHFGPDGFLYIADWYNKIISHNEVPRTHPDRDKTRGRIWRIRPVGVKTPEPVDFTKLADDKVIELLGGPSARTAEMAWAWLGERKNPETLAQLAKIAVEPKAVMARRLDAFRALELAKAVTPTLLKSLMADSSSAVRYQAVRAAGELQISPAEFVALLGSAPDDPSYRVRAALANAVRHHSSPSPEMIALVARLGREPLDDAGQWEKYDREFERYLARWTMETHPGETAKMLESDRALPQEGRLLAILSLEPGKAAAALVKDLPSLSRPLTKDELTLLGSQIAQPAVLAAFQLLLGDEVRRKPALQNLTRLDAASLANPALAAAVSSACEAVLSKSPSAEDRALVLKLGRLFRLVSLEPIIAAEIKDGARPADLVQTLSALREIGSNRIELFAGLLDHPDDAVRREAISALAFSADPKAVDMLAGRWAKLPGALRTIAIDGLTSSKEKAAAFAKAAAGGAFTGLDAGVFEKLIAVLGSKDPSLASLMEKTAGMFRSVIRAPGKAADGAINLTVPFTVETWIKLDPGIDNNDSLLGKAGGADFNFYGSRLRVHGGREAGDLITANRALVADVWIHCAVTRDAEGNFRIYFDGELDQDKGRPYREPLQGLEIGVANTGRLGAARYDEFRIWDVARSADEIRANFRTRLDLEKLDHLVKRVSGDSPGGLATEMTHDFPTLVSPAEAASAAAKFAKFRAMTEKPGDPVAGRATFQATCMICHQVKGEGMQIGPDLSGIGAMGVQGILRNVLDPNAQLESGYYRHDVSLTDGSLVSGFLVEETKDSITIRPVGADPKVIPRASISSHAISKRSLMPEGLIEGFNEKQVADLFSYLMTLK